MCFQLEVEYYSNEANKTKYKSVYLIASTKNNLKIAREWTTCHTCCLDLKILCCLKVMFVSAR